MIVKKAAALGFCGGVAKAMSLATGTAVETVREGKKLYLLGELVHNSYVSSQFLAMGATIVNDAEEVSEPGVVIIRTHGIADTVRRKLEAKGCVLVDATCPVVLHNQALVRESRNPVLVFGYPHHSEVEALVGAAETEVEVISRKEDLSSLDRMKHYRVVVQTTFSEALLEELLQKAKELGLDVEVSNSICSASRLRRQGVRDLAEQVEAFVVVGDPKSANSKELVTVAQGCGLPVFFTDGEGELPEEVFRYRSVGLTAGASTPEALYGRVMEKLERNGNVE